MSTGSATQIFLRSVQESFKHWPILRIAKQQGFGGRNVNEKEEWLCESVVQIFCDNDTVYPDDLQEFISEALFNEFDTIVEDGSLPEICERLCQYYQMCKENRGGQVEVSLNKIIARSKSTPAIDVKKVENLTDEEDGAQGTCTPSQNIYLEETRWENHDLLSQFTNQSNESAMETDEPQTDEDGWEVVRRSKKK